jgi:hypothetical protein
MNGKFIMAWAVVFVVWMMGSFCVHGLLLHNDYATIPTLLRTADESMHYFPYMILAHVIMAGAFTWIYGRGRENKPPVAQGVRYGLAVALLGVVPTYLIYYAVQPMPGAIVAKQILFDGLLAIILGVVVASVYKEPARA